MRRIAVLQPSYMPWLGYLDQIARCDKFVFYDDVQYDKNGWRNRNRIRSNAKDGWTWLTVPVRLDSHLPRICDVQTDARVPWRRKHRKTLELEYARAPFRGWIDEHFGAFFATDNTNLADIAIASVEAMLNALNVTVPLYRSSRLDVAGDRNTRLLNMCKHFEATHYLSGAAAKSYLDVDLFERNGICVEWQAYEHPVYRQTQEPFISHLSALDALLNVGPAAIKFIGASQAVSSL